MLREMEEHLQDCPECRRKAEFTAGEREALVYDKDIPEMSPDFVQRVLAAVAQDQAIPAPPKRMTIWSQVGSRGWWALGTVAVVIIALLVAPDSFKNPVRPLNQVPQITESEQQTPTRMAEMIPAQQEKEAVSEPLREKMYFGHDSTVQTGRGSLPSLSTIQAADTMDDQVVVFRPSYIPADYRLVRVESDAENNITIYYANDREGYICLRTTHETTAESPADEITAARLAGEGSTPLAKKESQADAANSSDPTVIRWTTEHDGHLYQFELTGNLSPDEMIRVANSVK